jgi:hypothetical protein
MARVLEVEPLFTVFAAAAAMLLVTTFPSDDAFARGDFCYSSEADFGLALPALHGTLTTDCGRSAILRRSPAQRSHIVSSLDKTRRRTREIQSGPWHGHGRRSRST